MGGSFDAFTVQAALGVAVDAQVQCEADTAESQPQHARHARDVAGLREAARRFDRPFR